MKSTFIQFSFFFAYYFKYIISLIQWHISSAVHWQTLTKAALYLLYYITFIQSLLYKWREVILAIRLWFKGEDCFINYILFLTCKLYLKPLAPHMLHHEEYTYTILWPGFLCNNSGRDRMLAGFTTSYVSCHEY
jgi:hypothetical protein